MPTFIAVHKWKPQDEIAVIKEALALFTAMAEGKTPKDVQLCATYARTHGAFCVWCAPSQAILEKLFEQNAPIMKKGTEFVPVVQSVPPTIEYVLSLWQQIIQMAPK